MIYNLQLLRGVCALGVVIYHTHFQIVPGISTDFYGVAIFFAISGFIITEVTRADSSSFLLKRFVRVVPLYWLVTVVFFLLASFGIFNVLYTFSTWVSLANSGFVHLRGYLGNQASAAFTADAAQHLVESFLFIPTNRPPILGVGWTLNYEVFFYALFSVGLMISRQWSPLITVAALLVIKFITSITSCGAVCSTYAADPTWFFIIGIAVHYAWRFLKDRAAPPRSLMRLFAIAAAFLWVAVCLGWREPPFPVVAGVVILVLTAALASEAAGLVCGNRILLALGDASYSLYLTHLIIIETMRVIGTQIMWLDQSKSILVMLASIMMSVALAVTVHTAWKSL